MRDRLTAIVILSRSHSITLHRDSACTRDPATYGIFFINIYLS